MISQYDDQLESVEDEEEEELFVLPTLPIKQKIYYCLGHILNDLCGSVLLLYFLVCVTTSLDLTHLDAGIIFLFAQVIEAAYSIFLRYNFNKINFKKIGRRKFVHCTGTVVLIISFIVTLNKCQWCGSRLFKVVYFATVFALSRIGYTSCQISHLALAPEISVQKDDAPFLLKLRSCMTHLSNVLVFLLVWCLIKLQNLSWDEPDNPLFMQLSFTLSVLGLLTTTAFHIGLEEPRPPFKKKSIYLKKGYFRKIVFKKKRMEVSYNLARALLKGKEEATWKGFVYTKIFYKTCLLYIFSNLCVNCFNIYFVVYLVNVLRLSTAACAYIPLLVSFIGFLARCCLESIARSIGEKFLQILASIVTIIACVLLYLASHTRVESIFGAAIGIGFGMTTINWISFCEMQRYLITSNKFVLSFNDGVEKVSTGFVVFCSQLILWYVEANTSGSVDTLPRFMVSIVPIFLTSFVLVLYTITFPSQYTFSRIRQTRDAATQTSEYDIKDSIRQRLHLELTWQELNGLTDKVGQKLAYPNLPSPIF